MKVWKFIIGILLFIAPIGLYSTGSSVLLHAPIGTAFFGTDTSFAIHSFNWYTNNGRTGYWLGQDSPAEFWSSIYMIEFGLAVIPVGISLPGIMTIICLYAVALYVIFSIIDNEVLNLIADLMMIGCSIISIIAFFNYLNVVSWAFTETSVPIFGIIAGVAGILGFGLSIKEMTQPKKGSRKRKR